MNGEYSTSDTAEAAYLMAHGIKFKYVEKDATDPKEKKTIILENTIDNLIGELLLDWDAKQCPEMSFFLKYKWLLKQVNSRKELQDSTLAMYAFPTHMEDHTEDKRHDY